MNPVDDFVRKVNSELRELARKDEQLSKQEDDIKKKRAEYRARTAELNKALAVYQTVMGPAGDSLGSPATNVAVPEGTIGEVAYGIMSRHGGTMAIVELVAELERVGKLKPEGEASRANYGTVYQTLKREPGRFRKSDKGKFSVIPTSAPQQPS